MTASVAFTMAPAAGGAGYVCCGPCRVNAVDLRVDWFDGAVQRLRDANDGLAWYTRGDATVTPPGQARGGLGAKPPSCFTQAPVNAQCPAGSPRVVPAGTDVCGYRLRAVPFFKPSGSAVIAYRPATNDWLQTAWDQTSTVEDSGYTRDAGPFFPCTDSGSVPFDTRVYRYQRFSAACPPNPGNLFTLARTVLTISVPFLIGTDAGGNPIYQDADPAAALALVLAGSPPYTNQAGQSGGGSFTFAPASGVDSSFSCAPLVLHLSTSNGVYNDGGVAANIPLVLTVTEADA